MYCLDIILRLDNETSPHGMKVYPITIMITKYLLSRLSLSLSQYSNAGLLNDHQPALQRRSFSIMTLFYIPGPRVIQDYPLRFYWMFESIRIQSLYQQQNHNSQRVNKQFPEGVNCKEMLL